MKLIFDIPEDISQRLLNAVTNSGFKVNVESELTETEQVIQHLKNRTIKTWTALVANYESRKAQEDAVKAVDLSSIK